MIAISSYVYRAGAQDKGHEMERNLAAAKQRQFRPSPQLLLSFPLFPVRHLALLNGIFGKINTEGR